MMRHNRFFSTHVLGILAFGTMVGLFLAGCPSNKPTPTTTPPPTPGNVGAGTPTPMPAPPKDELVFKGLCDGSAAYAIDRQYIAVASDETDDDGENILAVYDSYTGKGPLRKFPLNDFLGIPAGESRGKKEADLEASAYFDGYTFWLSSQGRNKDGEERPARHQLFATKFWDTAEITKLELSGKPYQNLVQDFENTPSVKAILGDASKKSPEAEGGLNIEGMAATKEYKLILGFRNPVPNGKALFVPIDNPEDAVINGAKAKLGTPFQLDLSEGGKYPDRGIRDIRYWRDNDIYLLLGGSWRAGDDPKACPFAIFEWSGKPSDAPKKLNINLSGLNPEGLLVYAFERRRFQVLSDDGSIDGCKDKPGKDRHFRVVWRELP